MSWGDPRSFPRAIIHIDGDSFFASCEVAKDPTLRGKPVITGKERGIVSACTYEAKARGVKRGMNLWEVRKVCPDAIILPSDYETYSIVSNRMYEIVRRYTPTVEEYSIDECFADLTGLRRTLRMSYPDIAARIKCELEVELGMTFSVGLSATKVLAKIGSKWKKPDGLTPIPLRDSESFLRATAIEKIWGIGPNTSAHLRKFGIETAYDFAHRSEEWVRSTVSKPYQEIWHELNGTVMLELDTTGRETYQSIQKTKTFTPPSTDPRFIFSQLSKNIENACIKARRWGLVTDTVSFFLKTQDFRYRGCEVKLSNATALPEDILRAVSAHFTSAFKAGVEYRATGVTLQNLKIGGNEQLDLFGAMEKTYTLARVYEHMDALSEKFGKHAVFLASSFHAMAPQNSALAQAGMQSRAKTPGYHRDLFRGETTRKRIGIAYLGEVS